MSIGVKVVIGMMCLYLVSGLFDTITGLTNSVTLVSSVLYLLCIATGITGSVFFLASRRAQLFRHCTLAALLFPALVYVTPEFSQVFPSPISLTLVSTGCITRQESGQERVVAYPYSATYTKRLLSIKVYRCITHWLSLSLVTETP